MIRSEASLVGSSTATTTTITGDANNANANDFAAVAAALETTATITSLYTKYDCLKLERIVGTKRVARMVQGEKSVFAFA